MTEAENAATNYAVEISKTKMECPACGEETFWNIEKHAFLAGVKWEQKRNKYEILKELINKWIKEEEQNYEEAKIFGGINCAAAGMAIVAMDAFKQVLSDISELEREVGIND